MEFTKEQKLYQEVIQKAWEDSAFKNELIKDPLRAIEELTGVKLNIPEGKTIVVRDQTNETNLYINIPVSQDNSDVELNEEQLETVAGGADIIPILGDIFPQFPPKGCFPTYPPIDSDNPINF